VDHSISNRFLYAAVAFALLGVLGGIYMAASHDHAAAPAHAHLLLLGWVSMAIFGFFYRLVPHAAGRLAVAQWWLMAIAVPVMAVGITVIRYGDPGLGEPLASASSVAVLAAMVLFAINLVRGLRTGSRTAGTRPQPAE
jgi:hypothetical protein